MYSDLKKFEQVVMELQDKSIDLAQIKYTSKEAVGLNFGDRVIIAERVAELIKKSITNSEEFIQEIKMIAYMLTGVYEDIHARRYEILRKYCSSLLNYYPKERRKRLVEKAYDTEEIFKNKLDELSEIVFNDRFGILDKESGKRLKTIQQFKKAYNNVSPIVSRDLDTDRDIHIYKEKESVKSQRTEDNSDQLTLDDYGKL